jgi:hypothetical protein
VGKPVDTDRGGCITRPCRARRHVRALPNGRFAILHTIDIRVTPGELEVRDAGDDHAQRRDRL